MLKDACIIEKYSFKNGIAVFEGRFSISSFELYSTRHFIMNGNAKNVVFKIKMEAFFGD